MFTALYLLFSITAITEIHPYEFIYTDFRTPEKIQFVKAKGLEHPFDTISRLKILMSIIKSTHKDGCGLDLANLKITGDVKDYFPLHEELERHVSHSHE